MCFPDVSAAASLFSHSLIRRPRLLFPKKKRSLLLSRRLVKAQSRKPGAVLDAGASAGPALSEGASSRGFEPCQLVGVYFVWCLMPCVTSSVLGGRAAAPRGHGPHPCLLVTLPPRSPFDALGKQFTHGSLVGRQSRQPGGGVIHHYPPPPPPGTGCSLSVADKAKSSSQGPGGAR